MTIRTFWLNFGWLVMLVVTVAVPLGLDAAGRLTYFTSLALWGIPILYLWPVFSMITAGGTGGRRRALRAAMMVSPIIPDGSYPHHCRGIASVTSQISDVRMTYNVVTANAGQFVKLPMARYKNTAGRRGDAIFPVEAAAVWLFTPFSCILTYEFAKALTHHPRTTKVALFGSVAVGAPS